MTELDEETLARWEGLDREEAIRQCEEQWKQRELWLNRFEEMKARALDAEAKLETNNSRIVHHAMSIMKHAGGLDDD